MIRDLRKSKKSKVFIPNTEATLLKDLKFKWKNTDIQMNCLKRLWMNQEPFFRQKYSKKELENHDITSEEYVRIPVESITYQSLYIGTVNQKDEFNGRGVLLSLNDCRIFEGFFKKGIKHGKSREITLSDKSPYVVIKEATY
jgi:hypothetical protein